MTENAPGKAELKELLGQMAFDAWEALVSWIDDHYAMDRQWSDGGKAGRYELKFRRGGKTLCALYAREERFALMVIYGRKERETFESRRMDFPVEIGAIYDETRTYHDGKWLMIETGDSTLIPAFREIIAIKRKPRL